MQKDTTKTLNAGLVFNDRDNDFQGYLLEGQSLSTLFKGIHLQQKSPVFLNTQQKISYPDFIYTMPSITDNLIIWRNGRLQKQNQKEGYVFNMLNQEPKFIPPLLANETVLIEFRRDFKNGYKKPKTYEESANHFTCNISSDDKYSFSLEWGKQSSTLSGSHGLVDLATSSLDKYRLESPDRFSEEITKWLKDKMDLPHRLNIAVSAHYSGKVIPLNNATAHNFNIESYDTTHTRFLIAATDSFELSTMPIGETLKIFRRIDSCAGLKNIRVFWKVNETRGSLSPMLEMKLKELTDSMYKAWPDKVIGNFSESLKKPADNLFKTLTNDLSDQYEHDYRKKSPIATWQQFYKSYGSLREYLIESSNDGLSWILFDTIRDASIIKKSYRRSDLTSHYFRVRGQYQDLPDQVSNTVVLNGVDPNLPSNYINISDNKLSPKNITVTISCILSSSYDTLDTTGKFVAMPSFDKNRITESPNKAIQQGDTIYVLSDYCKQYFDTLTSVRTRDKEQSKQALHNESLIKIHGSIQYDFTYRSLVDTPFYQRGFSQHTVQTSVDLLVKDNYPFHVNLLTRKTNSPYLSNITDVNVQFNNNAFLNNIKNKLRQQIPTTASQEYLRISELKLKAKQTEIQNLQNWLNDPARIQDLIKEKSLSSNIKDSISIVDSIGVNKYKTKPIEIAETKLKTKTDSLSLTVETELKRRVDSMATTLDSLPSKRINGDSSLKKSISNYSQKFKELQKLLESVKEYEHQIKTFKKKFQDSINRVQQEIGDISDVASLKSFSKSHDIKGLPKGWQHLMNLNSVGVGRNWLDYSELTVKNISLTGINLEASPKPYYIAVAAGRIDYRFRDFIIKSDNSAKQSLFLARAGLGKKDGNNLIFSYYNGKRAMLNSFSNAVTSVPLEKIVGISLENRLALNTNNYVTIEIAKSSFQTGSTLINDNGHLSQKVIDVSDRSNEAYSIKLNSLFPLTFTRVSGFYKKMGEHFQSFNLQPLNVAQEAYQIKIQQSFWKQRLKVEASLRKNDFDNPLISSGISSRMVFKSFQMSLRIPKYPFVSAGFYPSSQLSILDNNVLVQNQYNTLSGIVNHVYKVGELNMITNAVYLKFYNNSADSVFLYYKANSFSINHNVNWRSFQFQGGSTLIKQPDLNVITIEQSLGYQFREWLILSGGMKYNRLNHIKTLWGNSANVNFRLKNFGTIQFLYDRSYLPGPNRTLQPIDIGRVNYYRSF